MADFVLESRRNVKNGAGMAVCALQRRLVVSNYFCDTLTVFEVCPNATFAWLFDFGGNGTGPLRFALRNTYIGGWMCFTVGSGRPTLLVAEAGNCRVQEVDVGGSGAVFVGFPIVVDCPRGVAASTSLLAVSAWTEPSRGQHLVYVYDASTRALAYSIGRGYGAADGQLRQPHGLRFIDHGKRVAVADFHNRRVSVFETADGACVGHVNTTSLLNDLEEWDDNCVGASFHTVTVVGKVSGTEMCISSKMCAAKALALLPGVGVVARDITSVQVFSRPEDRRWRNMSLAALAWMSAVVRAGLKPRKFVATVGTLA